jgi:hypothetical protein
MMDELPLPTLAPGLVDPELMAGDAATKQANIVLSRFNAALASNDATELESCFYADQAFWKDQLALTYHLRTFQSPSIIAESLLKTEKLRGVSKGIAVDGAALFLPATPVLVSASCRDMQYSTDLSCISYSNSSIVRSSSELNLLALPAVERSSSCLLRLSKMDMRHSSGRFGS